MYIIIFKIQGQGVPIHGLILEVGENIDIWRESMIKAGIYDPLQSDFQDPFKFSL